MQLKSASETEDSRVFAPPLVLWQYSVTLTDVAVSAFLLALKENTGVICNIVR